MKPASNLQPVSMRFPVEIKERLERHAQADGQSVTQLVLRVMACWMDGRVYQPLARPAPIVPEYSRPRGAPRKPQYHSSEPWVVKALNRVLGTRDAWEIADLDTAASAGFATPIGSFLIVRELLILGWLPVVRNSDRETVWIAPKHPAKATL